MNYIIGFIWLICLIAFFYIVGSVFSEEDRCGPFKILIGYLFYSFGIAILGISIQVLNSTYELFRCLMTIWIVILLISSCCIYIIRLKNRNTKWSLKCFVANYWVLILIIVGVVFLSIINYPSFWLGNRSDDGFYLSRIASYPYTEKPFEHDLATGLFTGHVINQYTINTHDLEASVFLQYLNIPIGIFARVFLSAESYIIFGCSIYALAHEIFCFLHGKKRYQPLIQFIPAIMFLFTSNFVYLANNGIMNLQDSWQTSTAMYFGSSIVRTSGFFLLLLPFIKDFSLDWKVISEVAGISVVLVSKSTIAVPLVLISAISYIFVWALYESSIQKSIILLFVLILCIAGFLLYHTVEFGSADFNTLETLEDTSILWLRTIMQTFILWLTLVGTIWGLLFRAKNITRLLSLELGIFILLFVPGFRTYSSLFSFYTFVIGRVITAFTYFIICTMISLIVGAMVKIRVRKGILTSLGVVFTLALAGLNIDSFLKYGGNSEIIQGQEGTPITLRQALMVLQKNPDFIPVSTENLAEALNNLEHEKGKLAVLTETYYESDGVADLKHVLTKCLAPTVIFPTANTRFVTTEDPVYGSYDVDQQHVFENFLINNDDESTLAFGDLLNRYQIDAVLLRDNKNYDANMYKLGFTVYETIYNDENVPEYYLYARD